MNDYLTFDKFITPVIIQIVFWLGLAGIIIMGLYLIVAPGLYGSGFLGLIILVVYPIFWRMFCEWMLVMFRILDELRLIRQQGESRP